MENQRLLENQKLQQEELAKTREQLEKQKELKTIIVIPDTKMDSVDPKPLSKDAEPTGKKSFESKLENDEIMSQPEGMARL